MNKNQIQQPNMTLPEHLTMVIIDSIWLSRS